MIGLDFFYNEIELNNITTRLSRIQYFISDQPNDRSFLTEAEFEGECKDFKIMNDGTGYSYLRYAEGHHNTTDGWYRIEKSLEKEIKRYFTEWKSTQFKSVLPRLLDDSENTRLIKKRLNEYLITTLDLQAEFLILRVVLLEYIHELCRYFPKHFQKSAFNLKPPKTQRTLYLPEQAANDLLKLFTFLDDSSVLKTDIDPLIKYLVGKATPKSTICILSKIKQFHFGLDHVAQQYLPGKKVHLISTLQSDGVILLSDEQNRISFGAKAHKTSNTRYRSDSKNNSHYKDEIANLRQLLS